MLLPGNGESDAGIWVNKFLSQSGERVAACLTRLATIVRRPSQFRCSVFASMLLHSILKFLHNSCGTRRDDDTLWKEDDHLSLKELYRESSNRPRKVSKEFKRIVSEQVVAVPSLRNAQQLLAGRLLLLKGQRTSKFKRCGEEVQGFAVCLWQDFLPRQHVRVSCYLRHAVRTVENRSCWI